MKIDAKRGRVSDDQLDREQVVIGPAAMKGVAIRNQRVSGGRAVAVMKGDAVGHRDVVLVRTRDGLDCRASMKGATLLNAAMPCLAS